MLLPLRITFRDIPPSDAISEYIRKRAFKLDKFFDRITGCRVVVECPHRRHHLGRVYQVLIDVVVPGNELVVGRSPGDEHDYEDVYAAIDASFNDMKRVLDEWATRRRGSFDRRHTLDEWVTAGRT